MQGLPSFFLKIRGRQGFWLHSKMRSPDSRGSECLSVPTGNRVTSARQHGAFAPLLPQNQLAQTDFPAGEKVGEERRRTPRFPFVAAAEVVDTSSGASIGARVSELSLHGCYIDMTNPLPEGTSIRVKIDSGGRHLDASGKVVYSVPHLGIGVSFHEVSVHSLIVLKEWLLLAAQAKYHSTR
jgi:hypothetical protein